MICAQEDMLVQRIYVDQKVRAWEREGGPVLLSRLHAEVPVCLQKN